MKSFPDGEKWVGIESRAAALRLCRSPSPPACLPARSGRSRPNGTSALLRAHAHIVWERQDTICLKTLNVLSRARRPLPLFAFSRNVSNLWKKEKEGRLLFRVHWRECLECACVSAYGCVCLCVFLPVGVPRVAPYCRREIWAFRVGILKENLVLRSSSMKQKEFFSLVPFCLSLRSS